MKKIFLLLTSFAVGFAAVADPFTYDETAKTLTIPYNQYGSKTSGDLNQQGEPAPVSVQYQGGAPDLLNDAVFDKNGNTTWMPALGESFEIQISGTADKTGKLQFFLIDQSEDVDYWGAWGEASEIQVTEGTAFSGTAILTITNTTQTVSDKESFGKDLATCDLVIAYQLPDGTVYADLSTTDKANRVISNCELSVTYEEAKDYENPFILTRQGPADVIEDGFNYQGVRNNTSVTKDAVKVDKYLNVEISGKAEDDMNTIMYTLIDNSADAGYYLPMFDDMGTFAANVKAGDMVSEKFSMKITVAPTQKAPTFQNVLLAIHTDKKINLYFSNFTITTTITDTPSYDEPSSIEEVATANTIENGFVYSAGNIVVYNVAGKVVATASQEFNVNSLESGVYFIQTQEGTIKFIK